ncbi:MAG: type II secretion system F family protein [Acidimicrobiales bacterium]
MESEAVFELNAVLADSIKGGVLPPKQLLWVGALAWFVALVLALTAALSRRPVHALTPTGPRQGEGRRSLLGGRVSGFVWIRAVAMAERLLASGPMQPSSGRPSRHRGPTGSGPTHRVSPGHSLAMGRADRWRLGLERAGIRRPAEEAVALVLGVGGLVVVTGWWLGGPAAGLLAGAGGWVVARAGLRRATARRRGQIADQLGEALALLSGNLRVGHSLLPALEIVGREGPAPVAEEFARVAAEIRLGRDIEVSLAAMGDRVDHDDLRWVMDAVAIHRQVGGDLAELLDRVGETLRARGELRRQVQVLTADGRLSAAVMFALPLVGAGALQLVSPGYLEPLSRGPGPTVVGLSAVLMVAGAFWMRRLVRPFF